MKTPSTDSTDRGAKAHRTTRAGAAALGAHQASTARSYYSSIRYFGDRNDLEASFLLAGSHSAKGATKAAQEKLLKSDPAVITANYKNPLA